MGEAEYPIQVLFIESKSFLYVSSLKLVSERYNLESVAILRLPKSGILSVRLFVRLND